MQRVWAVTGTVEAAQRVVNLVLPGAVHMWLGGCGPSEMSVHCSTNGGSGGIAVTAVSVRVVDATRLRSGCRSGGRTTGRGPGATWCGAHAAERARSTKSVGLQFPRPALVRLVQSVESMPCGSWFAVCVYWYMW